MSKNKKIIYAISSVLFVAIAGGVIFWIAKDQAATKNQLKKNQNQVLQNSGVKNSSNANALNNQGEADYKIETKQDATKAMSDLDSMVKSAGDTSL